MADKFIEIKTTVRSHKAAATKALRERVIENLERAGIVLVKELQKVLSVSAGGTSAKARRIRGSPGHKQYERYRHSLPGEPPRMITGLLRKSVTYKVDRKKLVVRVGLFKAAIYGIYLEYGVRGTDGGWRIAPRPWLRVTMKRMQRKLAKIIAEGE
jgi:hypothetical protein